MAAKKPAAPDAPDAPPRLPTAEEYDEAYGRLSEIVDTVGPIGKAARQVFTVINYDGDQTVTYDNIGQLLVFAHWIRRHAKELVELADNLVEIAGDDLDCIRREGRQELVPTVDEQGTRYDSLQERLRDLEARL